LARLQSAIANLSSPDILSSQNELKKTHQDDSALEFTKIAALNSNPWMAKALLHGNNLRSQLIQRLNEDQSQLLIRFLISCFFIIHDVGAVDAALEEITLIEVISSDFFIVEMKQAKLYYLCIKETGDVICSAEIEIPPHWHEFANQFQYANADDPPTLCRYMLSLNSDYPRYISKLIAQNSVEYKLSCRFLLAHSEWNLSSLFKKTSKNIFFPMSIKVSGDIAVESLHFVNGKKPLMESVAFVQTRSCEGIYILKETGHSIGTEKDGIAEYWREILECDANGFPK